MFQATRDVLDEHRTIPMEMLNLQGDKYTRDIEEFEINYISREEFKKVKEKLDANSFDFYSHDEMSIGADSGVVVEKAGIITMFVGNKYLIFYYNQGIGGQE